MVVAIEPTVVPPVRSAPVVRDWTPVPPEPTPSAFVRERVEMVEVVRVA